MTEIRRILRGTLVLAAALACMGAGAQAPAEAGLALAPGPASDRAQKESERALYWIRVLAEKPAAQKGPERRPAAPASRDARPVNDGAAAAPDLHPPSRVKPAPPGPAERAGAAEAPPIPARKTGAPPAAAMPGGIAGRAAAPDAVATAVVATAAPPVVAPASIAPPEVDEPDPGLIMTRSADPQFPITAMRRLRKGEVEVRFEVGADGRVEDASVVRTTSPNLNNAALDAVRQWQFKPTPRGHVGVVDLAFNLDS